MEWLHKDGLVFALLTVDGESDGRFRAKIIKKIGKCQSAFFP